MQAHTANSSLPPALLAVSITAYSCARNPLGADACCARERTYSPVPPSPSQEDHAGFAKAGCLGCVLSAWVSMVWHNLRGTRKVDYLWRYEHVLYVTLLFSSLKKKESSAVLGLVCCCGLGRGFGCFAEARL